MADPSADDNFIVISGHNPQRGKRERIGRVRSHITKQYFHKLHNSAEKRGRPVLLTENNKTQSRENACHPRIYKELPISAPIPDSSLQNPAFFAAETTRRMHKFFNVHLLGQIESNPFLRNVLSWSLTDPHFTSAKLLNASAWDDILESGELSSWTTRQRFITMRLLNDTLKDDVRARGTYPTVAAVQSLLGFELLIGNTENIDRLSAFYQGLIAEFSRPNNEIWDTMIRAHFLLSHADRLRRAGCDAKHPDRSFPGSHLHGPNLRPPRCPHYQYAFPVDLSLFTLNQNYLAEDQYIQVLLCDLYHLVALSMDWQTHLDHSTYDYILCLHEKLLSYIPDQYFHGMNGPKLPPAIAPSDTDNKFREPLRLSVLILTSCLLLDPSDSQSRNLAAMVTQLRSVLGRTHNHTTWTPFPGAQVWCYAIGLRFADPQRDRTWFLMQFLRTSHACVMKTWEETSKSMEVVTYGLERIRHMTVEVEAEN